MSIHDRFTQATEQAQKEKAARLLAFKEKSRAALQTLVRRRCTTIFIGCLDSIEQKFGYLWGNGKSFDTLTERENLFLQLWKDLRKEILDKSNLQTKFAVGDVNLFNVVMKEIRSE